jgi:hypothetical protein
MRKLLFLMLFISATTFAQIKINPVTVGLPVEQKEATELIVRIVSFETTSKTCQLYVELRDANGETLISRNIQLTEAQFSNAFRYNTAIENIILSKFNLTRKTE